MNCLIGHTLVTFECRIKLRLPDRRQGGFVVGMVIPQDDVPGDHAGLLVVAAVVASSANYGNAVKCSSTRSNHDEFVGV